MELAPDPFLDHIEEFLQKTGMTPTALGQKACGDPRFVFDLRGGRECRRATRDKVANFMAAYRASANATDPVAPQKDALSDDGLVRARRRAAEALPTEVSPAAPVGRC